MTGPGGTLIDRFGARRVLIVGMLSMIAGCTLLAYATHPAVAAVAVMLIGVNFGVSWPGFNALIATVVEGEVRQQYFGVNFALVNLGIGVGGVIGGFFVDVTDPAHLHDDLPRRRGERPDPARSDSRAAPPRAHAA